MGIDRTDFVNGMRGVIDAFAKDAKDFDYWQALLDDNSAKLEKWYNVEEHLYSWLLGRNQAFLSVLGAFEANREGGEGYEVD